MAKIVFHPIRLPKLFFRWDNFNFGVLAVIALVFGIVLFPVATASQRDVNRLESEGEWQTATVTALHKRKSGQDTVYTVYFRISSLDGSSFEQSRDVDLQSYTDTSVGADIDLFVWPTDPEINEYQEGDTAKVTQVLWILSLGPLTFGVGIGSLVYLRSKRALWLRDNTELQIATVLKSFSIFDAFSGTGHLKWKTQGNYKGRSIASIDKSDLQDYPPGTSISVYIDPDKPNRSYWEGDLGPPLRAI